MSKPSLLSRLAAAFRSDRPLAERSVADLEVLRVEARHELAEIEVTLKSVSAQSLAGADETEQREHRERLAALRVVDPDGRVIGGALKAARDTLSAIDNALELARNRERREADAQIATRFSGSSPFRAHVDLILDLRSRLAKAEADLGADLALLFREHVRGALVADPLEGVSRDLLRRLLGDRLPPSARICFESEAPVLIAPTEPREGETRRAITPEHPRGRREEYRDGTWVPASGPSVR